MTPVTMQRATLDDLYRAEGKAEEGAPTFAVEVRSENDYTPSAEEGMAAKRADYFAAGTEVVWDVDPLAKQIHVYRAANPSQAATYSAGETADAEPAVPGWTVAVDWVFA